MVNPVLISFPSPPILSPSASRASTFPCPAMRWLIVSAQSLRSWRRRKRFTWTSFTWHQRSTINGKSHAPKEDTWSINLREAADEHFSLHQPTIPSIHELFPHYFPKTLNRATKYHSVHAINVGAEETKNRIKVGSYLSIKIKPFYQLIIRWWIVGKIQDFDNSDAYDMK